MRRSAVWFACCPGGSEDLCASMVGRSNGSELEKHVFSARRLQTGILSRLLPSLLRAWLVGLHAFCRQTRADRDLRSREREKETKQTPHACKRILLARPTGFGSGDGMRMDVEPCRRAGMGISRPRWANCPWPDCPFVRSVSSYCLAWLGAAAVPGARPNGRLGNHPQRLPASFRACEPLRSFPAVSSSCRYRKSAGGRDQHTTAHALLSL